MKQIINLLLIIVVIFIAYSCGSNTEKPNDSTVKSEEITIDTALVAGRGGDDLAQYEITKEDALTVLHAFQQGNPDPGASNPNYISVPLNEFAVLAKELDGEGSYVAFSKKEDNLEVLFVGKPKDGGEEWRYFNFTRPCPPLCPDKADTTGISSM